MMPIRFQMQNLLYVEADSGSVDSAISIIDEDLAACQLIWKELVLFKLAMHGTGSLAATAPCSNLAGFLLALTNSELDWLLANDQHLLVLHQVFAMVLQLRFDEVLDLSFGLLADGLIFHVQRGGDAVG